MESRPHPDLVKSGSYVVHRKLEQNVVRFREQLEVASRESRLSVEHIAAKVVGRWRDGVPIEIEPWRDPDENLTGAAVKQPPNDFRYLPHDAEGFKCPRGAHVRRTNPRDAITFAGAVKESGELSSRHRIIRRGLPYGEALEPGATDAQERGLLFLCYSADLERQFELVQRAWCIDGDGFSLGDEQDFLLGNGQGSGKMLIPVRGERPRFVTVVPDLVVTRGMEYLFAPGLRALARLAEGQFATV